MPRMDRQGMTVRVVTTVVAALAVAVIGCGDGSSEPRGERLIPVTSDTPPSVPAPPPPPSREVAARWSRERLQGPDGLISSADERGILVRYDGSEVRGWGDPRVRRYVTVLFARMQYDFRAGDLAAVCRRVQQDYESCREELKSDASRLKRRGFGSPPLRLLWVRAYPEIAGIWVEGPGRERFRVPFEEKNGKWHLELWMLEPDEALGMQLVRAAD